MFLTFLKTIVMLDNYTAYKELLDSLNELHLVDVHNQKDKANLEVEKAKLEAIKARFEAFREYLSNNWEVFSRFHKISSEVELYLESFNLDMGDSIETMTNNLDTLFLVNEEIAGTKKIIDDIKKLDNHEVINSFYNIVDAIHDKMKLDEIEKYISQLKEIQKSASDIKGQLYKEMRRLRSILDSNQLWIEDSRRLENIESIKELDAGIEEAIVKRNKDIQNTLAKHRWLTNKRHKAFHDSLTSARKSFFMYQYEIDACRRSRMERFLRNLGFIFGMAALLAVLVWVLYLSGFWWIGRIAIGIVILIVGTIIVEKLAEEDKNEIIREVIGAALGIVAVLPGVVWVLAYSGFLWIGRIAICVAIAFVIECAIAVGLEIYEKNE